MFVEKLRTKLGLMFIWPESSTSEMNVDDDRCLRITLLHTVNTQSRSVQIQSAINVLRK